MITPGASKVPDWDSVPHPAVGEPPAGIGGVCESAGLNAETAAFYGTVNVTVNNGADSRAFPTEAAAAPGSVTAPFGRLPVRVRGRTDAGRRLAAATGPGRHHVVVVTGLGGVGKSTVALEYVSACQARGVEVLSGSRLPRPRG